MASIRLRALQAGHFTMPEASFVMPSEPGSTRYIPSLSFLIEHNSTDGKFTRIAFDLGLRRIFEEYPQQIQDHMQKRKPYDLVGNVTTSLKSISLTPNDIDYVILSHVHWDHIGMPDDFSNSTFIVGPGSGDVLAGKTHQLGSHAAFESDLLPEDRTIELARPGSDQIAMGNGPDITGFSTNRPWLSASDPRLANYLEHTLDLCGDGSVCVVHAPGHLQGHINMLVKTSRSQISPEYIYLAGDACHDRRLVHGEKQIAEWEVDGMPYCIHVDKKAAEETIKKIAAIETLGVEVIFAHDTEWEEREGRQKEGIRLIG